MNQIIETMVEQINQKPQNEPLRLFTALGASKMVYSDKENLVQFSVSGDKGVNKVVVKYDKGADLYNVEFWNINMRDVTMNKVDEVLGVYNDQLTDIIWRRCVVV